MEIIDIFNSSPAIFVTFIGLLGLIFGSFLNVVILRLPITLKQDWRKDCYEYLELSAPEEEDESNFSVLLPRSRCPKCKNQLRAIDNIPLLSYICLRGKCHFCKQPISLRYPLIEFLTAFLMILVALKYGATWQTVVGCFLTCVLIVQSGIDFDHKIIPDEITLPVLWVGIICSLFNVYVPSDSSIIGAVSGYLILWLVYWLFFIITKKEGMGYGDFKLLAMLGAFLGWQMLPLIIIFSSIFGSIVGLGLLLMKKCSRESRIPFGPFLAVGGWIALVYGPSINSWYLNYIGLNL